MNTGYFVIQRKQCETCKGEGTVYDPTGLYQQFGAFIQALEARTGLRPPELDNETEGEQFEWWCQHGYEVHSWETFNSNTPPEEEITLTARVKRSLNKK